MNNKNADNISVCMTDLQKLVWTSYARSGLKQDKFHEHLQRLGFDVCSIPAIRELCEMFNRTWAQIRPAFDIDGDWFSVISVRIHIVTLA
jgi:hypothetical protein